MSCSPSSSARRPGQSFAYAHVFVTLARTPSRSQHHHARRRLHHQSESIERLRRLLGVDRGRHRDDANNSSSPRSTLVSSRARALPALEEHDPRPLPSPGRTLRLELNVSSFRRGNPSTEGTTARVSSAEAKSTIETSARALRDEDARARTQHHSRVRSRRRSIVARASTSADPRRATRSMCLMSLLKQRKKHTTTASHASLRRHPRVVRPSPFDPPRRRRRRRSPLSTTATRAERLRPN